MQNAAQEQGKGRNKENIVKDSDIKTHSSSILHSCSSQKGENFTEWLSKFMAESSESEEEDISDVETLILEQGDLEEATYSTARLSKYILQSGTDLESELPTVDAATQAGLEALLEAAGIGKLCTADGKQFADPEVLRRLTSSVSCALDEAAAALTRMRSENSGGQSSDARASLFDACSEGDLKAVKKLLDEGHSVHETNEEGESLLSLACSSGYYSLAQVLLSMRANVEDRGMKGDCTPLMEAASAGHLDIVKLLIQHGADVNAQSSSGNTPLMFACAGGHEDVVRVLLEAGANVEDHNENGYTPLMEAASAGHVSVAKILLDAGASINTHSNEFKESALTLACYKGHLEMVKFLLESGADQEHKTDEMHTALMEASMDGHVEVARLLLDSGAQVNMPADSFESPLTLAACGGHVELAMLLIERGANIEEVNDEGYTPLMEAAREGHEGMVALLLSQGADLNAMTEETQETALTLACCGGFLEVADFLIKAGANIELGASTPLMEAAQEGHYDLVKYLLDHNGKVEAQTGTGDTALTYACENGHTDVADLLLQYNADLEHESEGGRTPLMKACRAGHLCTVQFLLNKGANVNQQTTNNDHTPLSLACAGGHLNVVELLLSRNADPHHKLKDNSTMIIEAAKGGHTQVVQLLIEWPNTVSNLMAQSPPPENTAPQPQTPPQHPSVVELVSPGGMTPGTKPVLPRVPRKNKSSSSSSDTDIPSSQSKSSSQDGGDYDMAEGKGIVIEGVEDKGLEMKGAEKIDAYIKSFMNSAEHSNKEEQILYKQQILEELQRVERELQEKAQTQLAYQPSSISTSQPLTLTNFSTGILDFAPTFPPSPMNMAAPGPDGSLGACYLPTSVAVQNPPGFVTTTTQSRESVIVTNPNSTMPVQERKKSLSSNGNVSIKKEVKKQKAATQQTPPLQQPPPPPPPPPQLQQHNHVQQLQQLQQLNQQLQQQVLQQRAFKQQQNAATLAALQQNAAQSQQQLAALQQNVQQLQQLEQHVAAQQHNAQLQQRVQQILQQKQQLQQQLKQFQQQVEQQLAYTQQGALCPNNLQQTITSATRPADGKWNDLDLRTTKPQEKSNLICQNIQPSKTTQVWTKPKKEKKKEKLKEKQKDERWQDVNCSTLGLSTSNQVPLVSSVSTAGSFQTLPSTQPSNLQFTGFHAQGLQVQSSAGIQFQYQQLAAGGSQTPSTLPLPAFQQQLVLQSPQLPLVDATTSPPIDQKKHTKIVYTPNQQQFLADAGGGLISYTSTTASQVVRNVVIDDGLMVAAPARSLEATTVSVTRSGVVTAATVSEPPSPPPIRTPPPLIPCVPPQGKHYTTTGSPAYVGVPQQNVVPGYVSRPGLSMLDLDSETDSNHDTALTLACAGGHEELVDLLLSRGADIEHRDKKGFTPLILAATAGHANVVEILLNRGADIEAQSERTKDTPLSLACSGGRYEVVESLLARGANKEHRNVSDYTPLSLAASGGYVNIIKLLLEHGAEINSRTGSKLGISPLMLAAMNGHVAAVKLLLDKGSDINAQIETNRNTALTLACFQGRHEVVSLLLERKANIEHRAKTGLTPLMEAASGGYVEVGRVLLDHGADVNAPPVPSSRDTALTIAADKGHYRFVELLLERQALVDVKNKKGNSPLWLAANGGHLDVVQLLYAAAADIDSEDNRKVSCLMAAFRKGHVKVVKWMVKHVTQFPSDPELSRYIATLNDKELFKKCTQCMEIIRIAKDRQAAEANKNATILLEELNLEKSREELKKQAQARKRERKKRKKIEKREEKKRLEEENRKNEDRSLTCAELFLERLGAKDDSTNDLDHPAVNIGRLKSNKQPSIDQEREADSGIDANSQTSNSSYEGKQPDTAKRKNQKKQQENKENDQTKVDNLSEKPSKKKEQVEENNKTTSKSSKKAKKEKELKVEEAIPSGPMSDLDEFLVKADSNKNLINDVAMSQMLAATAAIQIGSKSSSPKRSGSQGGKRDEGWKEVVRRSKKVSVPSNAISRVIGRGGCNINAIREFSGAHIEVEKQKGQGDRTVIIRGSADATRQANTLITLLINEPDKDLSELMPKSSKAPVNALAVSQIPVFSAPPSKPVSVSPKPTPPVCVPVVKPARPATTIVVAPVVQTQKQVVTSSNVVVSTWTNPVTTSPKRQPAAPAPEKRASSGGITLTKTTLSMSTTTSLMKVMTATTTTVVSSSPVRSPQEYSPFNNIFSKVPQASMWRKEEVSGGRGMNFASVAASGLPARPNQPSDGSPQADAAKAPGYRGSMGSPVSGVSPPPSPTAVSVPISCTSTSSPAPSGVRSAPGTPAPPGPIAPPPRKAPVTPPPTPSGPLRPSSLPDGRDTSPGPCSKVVGAGRNLLGNGGFNSVRSATPPPINPNLAPGARPIMEQGGMFVCGESGPRFTAPQALPSSIYSTNLLTPISTNLPIQSKLNPNAPDFSISSKVWPSGTPNPTSQQHSTATTAAAIEMAMLQAGHRFPNTNVPMQRVPYHQELQQLATEPIQVLPRMMPTQGPTNTPPDSPGSNGEESRRLPRPIGVERAHRKPSVANQPRPWGVTDIQSQWLSQRTPGTPPPQAGPNDDSYAILCQAAAAAYQDSGVAYDGQHDQTAGGMGGSFPSFANGLPAAVMPSGYDMVPQSHQLSANNNQLWNDPQGSAPPADKPRTWQTWSQQPL